MVRKNKKPYKLVAIGLVGCLVAAIFVLLVFISLHHWAWVLSPLEESGRKYPDPLAKLLLFGERGGSAFSLDPNIVCSHWYEKRERQNWNFVLALSNSAPIRKRIAISNIPYQSRKRGQVLPQANDIQYAVLQPDEMRFFYFDIVKDFEIGVFENYPSYANLIKDISVKHSILSSWPFKLLQQRAKGDTVLRLKHYNYRPFGKMWAIRANSFILHSNEQAQLTVYVNLQAPLLLRQDSLEVTIYPPGLFWHNGMNQYMWDIAFSQVKYSDIGKKYRSAFIQHSRNIVDSLQLKECNAHYDSIVYISPSSEKNKRTWKKVRRSNFYYVLSHNGMVGEFKVYFKTPLKKRAYVYEARISLRDPRRAEFRDYADPMCDFLILPAETHRESVIDRIKWIIRDPLGFHYFIVSLDFFLLIAIVLSIWQFRKRRKLRAKSSTQVEN